MKKMLYLMSVDWAWIAQRPHFLALELSKYYDITVIYPKQVIRRWKAQTACARPNKFKVGLSLPFQECIPLFSYISKFFFTKAIGDVSEYDIIMIGAPFLYQYVEDYTGCIVYDCMDNYEALEANHKIREKVKINHINLLKKAEIVIVSSLKLKECVENYRKDFIFLVRNGYKIRESFHVDSVKKREIYSLGYIGTISSWMDGELLSKCVECNKNIEIHLIGPLVDHNHINNVRIIYEGVVEHNLLYDKIKAYDCLIMPFILNDIVLAVDPVKLYEYISFGKCIISIYYPEVEGFGDYVYFYKTDEEFIYLIKKLEKEGFPPKYTQEMQNEFLQQNSWAVRGSAVYESIECVWNKTRSYKDVSLN